MVSVADYILASSVWVGYILVVVASCKLVASSVQYMQASWVPCMQALVEPYILALTGARKMVSVLVVVALVLHRSVASWGPCTLAWAYT